MDNLILKILARFVTRGTDAGSQIGAPSLQHSGPMLSPAERHEIKAERIAHRGVIFIAYAIYWCESIERQSGGDGRILIREGHAPPMYRRGRVFTPGGSRYSSGK